MRQSETVQIIRSRRQSKLNAGLERTFRPEHGDVSVVDV